MVYIPDANDATQPVGSTDPSTAAAEFRAIKAKVNAQAASIGINVLAATPAAVRGQTVATDCLAAFQNAQAQAQALYGGRGCPVIVPPGDWYLSNTVYQTDTTPFLLSAGTYIWGPGNIISMLDSVIDNHAQATFLFSNGKGNRNTQFNTHFSGDSGSAATFTGSQSGNVLTVTTFISGNIVVGDFVVGGTASGKGYITSFGTGTGANPGTYNISTVETVAAGTSFATHRAYQKNVIYNIFRQGDKSFGGGYKDGVTIFNVGIIQSGNTTGRMFGENCIVRVEAGADGYVQCKELAIENFGVYQPLIDLPNSKYCLTLIASGTVNSTHALLIKGVNGTQWHDGVVVSQLAIDSGGTAFKVIDAFNTTIASVDKYGAANFSALTVNGVAVAGGSFAQVSSNTDVSIAQALFSPVQFNNVEVDSAGIYNTGTKRFTPITAGWYEITGAVCIGITGGASLYSVAIAIRKNGTNVRQINTVVNTVNNASAIVSGFVYCNGSTDYIDIAAYKDGTAGVTVMLGLTQLTYATLKLVK